jgi:UDP-galactopyranose mutase
MAKAYPFYDASFRDNIGRIDEHLRTHVANVQPVGRNGMHRYNNQDHSMLTAMLAVENFVEDAHHDLWSVNLDGSYHEEA